MQTNNLASDTVWAFFGTSEFSVIILDELKAQGFKPSLIITVEDKPKGRKLVLTPPAVKLWAEKEGIPFIQPQTLRNPEVVETIKKHSPNEFDIFIVAAYGKIIPENILNIPKYGSLNVHPSLLPLLRGASPIQSAILKESETGVTIIKLDKEMDHGPIVAQQKVPIDWPPYEEELEKELAKVGGKLLSNIVPDWISGKIKPLEQDHSVATFCGKIQKVDAELNLNDPANKNLRKIRAYHAWPGAYFFEDSKRIIVKKAHIEAAELILDRIIPEGKKEMSYGDYLKGKKN